MKDTKIFLKKKKIKGEKRLEKNIKILLMKKKINGKKAQKKYQNFTEGEKELRHQYYKVLFRT